MALAANRDVDHYIDQELRSFQVAASAHVFKGAVVGINAAGHAGPLTAGDPFVGMAYEEMDNSSGTSTASTPCSTTRSNILYCCSPGPARRRRSCSSFSSPPAAGRIFSIGASPTPAGSSGGRSIRGTLPTVWTGA